MTQPLVVRPRRLTWMAWAMATLVAGVFAVIGWALKGSAGPPAPPGSPSSSGVTDPGTFGLLDQLAMTGLGLLLGGAALLLTRARVVAGADGVRVRNVVGETALPWEVVRAVRFDDGASWASLELQDDDTVALLAVQANDGGRAVDAVLALRQLLAQSRAEHDGPRA